MTAPTVDVVLKLSGSATASRRALERLIGNGFNRGGPLLNTVRDYLSDRGTGTDDRLREALQAANTLRAEPHQPITMRFDWTRDDGALHGGLGETFRLFPEDRFVAFDDPESNSAIIFFMAKVGASRQRRYFVMFRGTPERVLELIPRLRVVTNAFWRSSLDIDLRPDKGTEIVAGLRDLTPETDVPSNPR